MDSFQSSLEIGLATFFTMEDVPLILKHPDDPKKEDKLMIEMLKCLVGKSNYTFPGLFFVFLLQTNGFIAKSKTPSYLEQKDELKKELIVSVGGS